MTAKIKDKNSRSIEKRKTELIKGLRDVRKRILSLASSLPESKQNEIFLGERSSRDLLAHLAGWDETNIRAANEILADQLPSFFEHSDKDWVTYNTKLVSEYSRDDFEELLALVRETHEELLTLIKDLPASELWNDRGVRTKGWKVTIGRLLEVEREDEEEHFIQLKQFVEIGTRSQETCVVNAPANHSLVRTGGAARFGSEVVL